jgi:hypothetical protein
VTTKKKRWPTEFSRRKILVPVGTKFGSLVTVGAPFGYKTGPGARRLIGVVVRCEKCGHIAVAAEPSLRLGKDRSSPGKLCRGCHPASREHPLYRRYAMMKERCTNPNSRNWSRYGGRGIGVCKRWMDSFKHYIEDVGVPENLNRDLHLDRVDNNGDYEPGNVRWVSSKENNANQSRNTLHRAHYSMPEQNAGSGI